MVLWMERDNSFPRPLDRLSSNRRVLTGVRAGVACGAGVATYILADWLGNGISNSFTDSADVSLNYRLVGDSLTSLIGFVGFYTADSWDGERPFSWRGIKNRYISVTNIGTCLAKAAYDIARELI